MRCLDGGLPSLGTKGMVMIRFAAEEDDISTMSYRRGDAVDTVTADDELHGLNRFIRQSRRLPIRSRTSCGPRVIRQDTVDQSLYSLTAKAVEDAGRNHLRFIPDGHTGQDKRRVAQAADLSLDIIGRRWPLTGRFRLEIGHSRCSMAIFIPQSQSQIPIFCHIDVAVDGKLSSQAADYVAGRLPARWIPLSQCMAADAISEEIGLITAIKSAFQKGCRFPMSCLSLLRTLVMGIDDLSVR